jgi:hypothetical protein
MSGLDQLRAILATSNTWLEVDANYVFQDEVGTEVAVVSAKAIGEVDSRIPVLMRKFALNETPMAYLLDYAVSLWLDPGKILYFNEDDVQGLDIRALLTVHPLDDGKFAVVCKGRRLNLLQPGLWFATEYNAQSRRTYQIDVTLQWLQANYEGATDRLQVGVGIGLSGEDLASLIQSGDAVGASLPDLGNGPRA